MFIAREPLPLPRRSEERNRLMLGFLAKGLIVEDHTIKLRNQRLIDRSLLRRSVMFIAREPLPLPRRSEERNISRLGPVVLSSAPPNGAWSWLCSEL